MTTSDRSQLSGVQSAPGASNLDPATVAGFGDEWTAYRQDRLDPAELGELFARYFSLFDFASLPAGAIGFDLGCGSGRWAARVAPRVGWLHCVDASPGALSIARANLGEAPNCSFHQASVDAIPLDDGSMDFGYSLGVLHHLPDPASGLRDCVRKLKPGAPFLVYLYYALENRAGWYRALWRLSDTLRHGIARLPFGPRRAVCTAIAALVYWPLARLAAAVASLGVDTSSLPLDFYRGRSFYTMRTDALDRFGTRLEWRFTAEQIITMMRDAGLERVSIANGAPYWRAIGFRAAA